MAQLSHPYITTGKTIALTIWTFVSQVLSLLFTSVSGLVMLVPNQRVEPRGRSTPMPSSLPLSGPKLRTSQAASCWALSVALWGRCGIIPGGSDFKEFTCHAGDLGSIPGLGRSPEEGSSYPLQCSCPENPMDRGAWWARVHSVTKSLSDFHYRWGNWGSGGPSDLPKVTQKICCGPQSPDSMPTTPWCTPRWPKGHSILFLNV